MGTACYLKGAEKIQQELIKILNIAVGETTDDGLFHIEEVRCLGCCGLAPVISINGKVYGPIKTENIKKILENYKK